MSSKMTRMFSLLQLLRAYRYPVSATTLAEKLGVSLRTIYRDINNLKAQGADLEGEPGLGYQLKPSFLLPPLMFDKDEIDALVLGMRWVNQKADVELQRSSQRVLDKIRSVIPQDLQKDLDLNSLMIGPDTISCLDDTDMRLLRKATRSSVKVEIQYQDAENNKTKRKIWPLGIAFFDGIRILIAWCEKRQAFRHFRTDRIQKLIVTDERFPTSKAKLLKMWRDENNIPEQ